MRVGLGLAGAGWLGECLIKDLPGVADFWLAAVQDTIPERSEAVARTYAAASHGTEFDHLLRADGVDAVVICTPNALHGWQARAALGAGKHVLVQKPLGLNPTDVEATIRQAREAGRILFPDYTYRYLETSSVVQQLQPSVGKVRRIRAAFHNIYGPGKGWFFDPALSGGGALMDLGVHLIDMALAVVHPVEARLKHAALSFERGYMVEDAATLELELDATPVYIETSWNAPLAQTQIFLELEGERGRLRWENVDGSFFHFRAFRDEACLLDRETTLRIDTLRAFHRALSRGVGPAIEARVYDLLAQAYALAPWRIQSTA